MTQNEILAFLKKQKHLLQKHYGVLSIGLFGSYARNEQSSNLEDNLHVKIDI